jgi:protein arginine kinase activator
MLCQDCRKKEATVHLTQIINNEKVTLNFCDECAEKKGFHSPLQGASFPLAEFLSSIMDKGLMKGSTKLKVQRCPKCGVAFSDFGKAGRLGCGNCYRVFKDQLRDLLRKIHGSDMHRGKIPPAYGDVMKPIREEKRLEEELKKAVESENFEMAAQIRDKIKALPRNKG